ncbi:hypothetical protein [Photobacterium indicum]|jgi:hypothetical protein|uniref:Uncharacterized protein n=1 Tax=Photobacterium indicum TaxID=81447 RepID=A0A2T3LF90_9GAMM|nr:hypothetical protein [Photobacterium indicum]PSV50044.1 hypothetical protein C9J47_05700 [Photobacterium indicum]
MTQLFNDDESNVFFHKIIKEAKSKNIVVDLVAMNNEILGSKALGYVLYDSDAIELGFEIDREFFAEHYMSIFEAMASNGVRESWIKLIKALLGEDTLVEFEIPNAGHLRVNVKEKITEPPQGLILENGGEYGGIAETAGINKGIMMNRVSSNYTINQARNVLENLAVEGIFTEFNLVG